MDRDVRLRRGERCDEWIKDGYMGGSARGGGGQDHPEFPLSQGILMELTEIHGHGHGNEDGHGTKFGDGYGIGSDSTVPEWTHDSDTSLTSWSQSPPLLPPGTYSVDQLVHPNDSVSRYGSPDDFDVLHIPSPPPAPRGSLVAQQAQGPLPTFFMEDVMDNLWASEDVRWVLREKRVA